MRERIPEKEGKKRTEKHKTRKHMTQNEKKKIILTGKRNISGGKIVLSSIVNIKNKVSFHH